MKRFSEQFKKQSESIRMRVPERSALRERLVSYMEYHPLPAHMKSKPSATSRKEGIASEPFKVIAFNTLYVRSFVGIFAVLLIVSVPFVAEHALPGDVLYPVKIQFNEELRSNLALSPYAKVEWETERLERRISEARLLASEGKLTTETETQVAQAVKDHADAAQEEIAQLRQSDSDGAAIAEIALSSALAVQSEVLEGNASTSEQTAGQGQEGHSVAALAQVVAEARDSVQASQAGQTTSPSYEKLLARIEQESTLVSELFASVKKEASSDEVTAVERSLADIQRKVDQAKTIKDEAASNSDDAAASASSSELEPIQTSASTSNASKPTSTSTGTTTVEADASTSTEEANDENASSSQDSSDATTTPAAVAVGTSATAVELLRSALGDLQKVMSYLTHIDVRQSVSIQDLVPVTPTSEEQVLNITTLYNDTRTIQAALLGIVSDKSNDKVTLGENELESKLTGVIALMKEGDLDGALTTVTQAHAIAVDLRAMTAHVDADETEASSSTPEDATSTPDSAE